MAAVDVLAGKRLRFVWPQKYGANNYGQLGIGRICEQCNEPAITADTELQLDKITSIKGGGGHTLMLNQDGKVYGCGLNSSHQLAINCDKASKIEPIKCLDKYKISQIACGWDCSFAVTEDGCVLVWGSNTYGQLGINRDQMKKVKEPVKLDLIGVTQISCGLRHTAILLSNGKVMVTGQGKKGQLGIVKDGHLLTQTDCFQEVPDLENVKTIACGQNHTIALTKNGKIFAWGDNKHGQLASSPCVHSNSNSPLICSAINSSNITTILLGWTHSMFLTEEGSIINNGRNCYGQLGCHSESRPASWIPNNLVLNKRVKQIAVGSEHNIILSDNGEVWSWGWNEHGNCGLGNEVNIFQPTQINLPHKALLIGTGSAHSFALTEC